MGQRDWRFCGKCSTLFFDGDPGCKGACPADGHDHVASGFVFDLPHDVPESTHDQGAWCFCQRCFAMFFNGGLAKGACDAGSGGHSAKGFLFMLPHDVPGTPTAQSAWRGCGKCSVMFFDGFDNKGICAGGVGGHRAEGFMFVLPHDDDEVLAFDTGPVTSNLSLCGSAHLVINRSGAFTFSTHAHDSGADDVDYFFGVALLSPKGVGFTFGHQGSVEGTLSALPFGTPRRNDDKVTASSHAQITSDFDKLAGAVLSGQLAGADTLVGGDCVSSGKPCRARRTKSAPQWRTRLSSRSSDPRHHLRPRTPGGPVPIDRERPLMSQLPRRAAAFLIAGIATMFTMTAPASATPPGENGQLAFRRYLDPNQTTSAIFAVRPNGTGERALTRPRPGTLDTQPDWSPDGKLVGFERCRPDTVCAIYTVRPSGTQLTRLSPPCHAKPPAIETKCPDESGIAFMPDGRHVVFTRATGRVRVFPNGDGFIEHSDLVIRDLSGRHTRVVLRGRPFSGDNGHVVAAPDGTRLAFQRQNSPLGKPAGATAVFVVGVDGQQLHRITPWSLDAGDHPDWSPDGRWILFRSNTGGNFLNSQLYLVHPDGTGMHQITHLSADTLLLSASFSPDGERIVYAQTGTGGLPDIFTMDTDGTDARQVTRTPRWDSAPDWGPEHSHRR